MPRLEVARRDHVVAIYRESHALWGGGLAFNDYLGFWDDLQATDWGRQFVTFQVWIGDDGRLLSSFKLYRPRMRVLGREGRACLIGAVFTPAAARGRGHATAMIRAALEDARARGDDPAMLYSDIGTRFYATLGFHALPAEEFWGRPPRGRPAPPRGWTLRVATAEDQATIERLHDEWCRTRPIAVLRDEDHWRFLHLRMMRYLRRLADARLDARFRIAESDGEPRGYVLTVEAPGEWNVRELATPGRDADGAAAILEATLAEARAAGVRRCYGWLPGDVTSRVSSWRLRRGSRRRAVPMLLPLRDGADLRALNAPDAAFLPYQDQF